MSFSGAVFEISSLLYTLCHVGKERILESEHRTPYAAEREKERIEFEKLVKTDSKHLST